MSLEERPPSTSNRTEWIVPSLLEGFATPVRSNKKSYYEVLTDIAVNDVVACS